MEIKGLVYSACTEISKTLYDTFSIPNIKRTFNKTRELCTRMLQTSQPSNTQKTHPCFKALRDAIGTYTEVNIPCDNAGCFEKLNTFLDTLATYKIPYFFVQRALECESCDIKYPFFCRYWYFQKFDIENNFDILKKCGCNCIDLINLCRIKFNKFPPYSTTLGPDDPLLKQIMEPNFTLEQRKIAHNYGSYSMWYYYFKSKNRFNIESYRDLAPGTLLLTPHDCRQHVAIILSNDNKGNIEIIHSYPEGPLDLVNEIGLCDPGIRIDDLKTILCEWQEYFIDKGILFNFELAIPINEWLTNDITIDKSIGDLQDEVDDLQAKVDKSKNESTKELQNIYEKYKRTFDIKDCLNSLESHIKGLFL